MKKGGKSAGNGQFNLVIENLDNSAVTDDVRNAVCVAFTEVMRNVLEGFDFNDIRDENGNVIGKWSFSRKGN